MARKKRSDASEQETVDQPVCPECGSTSFVEDPERGELVCENCGLVIEERRIERGPEWRTYEPEEREKKSRVGPPESWRLHDKGLTTEIDWRDANAYGKALTPERRVQMRRLREWQQRMRSRGSERRLRFGLGEIERMASALDVPKNAREVAAMIFRRALEEGLLPGRSIEAMAASALYAACRQEHVPRGIDDVIAVSRVDPDSISRTYRYLVRELELEIRPPDPAEFVPRIVSELGLGEAVGTRAIDIVRETAALDLTSGKSPKGYAAAAVYLATCLADERRTQEEIGEAANVSTVTIRNRYHEQAEALGIEI